MNIKDYLKKYDRYNQFDVLINSYKQIEFAWNIKTSFESIKVAGINNIIISGLGGSAISADVLKNYLRDEFKYPVFVNRNYDIPKFASESSLFIASSYSGNTEETISSLQQAVKLGCQIITITTGGEVAAFSSRNNIPCIKLQEGFQPRYALGLSFFALLRVLQDLKLISDQSETVKLIVKNWKLKGELFSKEDNEAEQLAKSIIGFIPVIYSVADITDSVGYRFKCQLNENSKLHAFNHQFPEMNHNEIIGWESHKSKSFCSKIIFIMDESYNSQIKKRFEIFKTLLNKDEIDWISISSDEKSFKVRLFEMIYLSDWVSFYAGILRGFDPSEIKNIVNLKNRLQ